MPPRQQIAKRQLLQLAVNLVQAQAVGDGAVNIERFLGNPPPLAARHIAHGAHIVGAVGQFDENDAHVARHGQQHFAKGLGLVFFAGGEVDLFQLGQAVDQLGHGRAKALDQVYFGDAAVLHGVVQQGGHEGGGIELPLGALGGHSDRVRDVGLPAAAQLAQMRLIGKAVGLAHLLHLGGRQIVKFGAQAGKAGHHRLGRSRSGAGWRWCFAHVLTVARPAAPKVQCGL